MSTELRNPKTASAPMKSIPPSTSVAVPDEPRSGVRKALGFLGRSDGDPARVLILLLLIVVIGIVAPSFISKASWIATSQSSTVIILLAIGQAFVIITGGIDLSVGAVLAASSMLGAITMRAMYVPGDNDAVTVITGFLVALVAGAFMGLVNGLVITRLKITPFIATLGMLGVATGATNLLSGGTEVVGLPPVLGFIGNTGLFGGWVTIPVLVTLLVAIIAGLFLSRTRFGMRTYAIGSNSGAARRSAIGVDRHLLKVYVLSGLLASVAGILLMSRFVGASPLAGQSTELAAIAAAVGGGGASPAVADRSSAPSSAHRSPASCRSA